MSLIQFKFTKEETQALRTCGADHSVYASSSKFELDEVIMPFKPKLTNVRNVMYSVQKQIDGIEKVSKNPIKGHPLIVLGSYPTDSRAKLLGANYMLNAISQYRKMIPRQRRGKSQPIWHKLYGGYKDVLLDGNLKPSFIVISNVTEESTPFKLEKLRDILERHSDVPRIIVMGTKEDPVTLIAQKLFLSIKEATFIGGHNIVRNIMDE